MQSSKFSLFWGVFERNDAPQSLRWPERILLQQNQLCTDIDLFLPKKIHDCEEFGASAAPDKKQTPK
jgi:hypothetical protein